MELSIAQRELEADRELEAFLLKLGGSLESKTVVDVGANIGDFCELALNCGFTRVHCLEPAPEPYVELVDRFGALSAVTVHNIGVSETGGAKLLYLTRNSQGSSFLEPVPGQTSEWANVGDKQLVPSLRLDEFFDREKISFCDLLKVDTQGTDLRVLQSLGVLLDPSRIGSILIEANFHTFYEGQDKFHEVLELLYAKGYFLADLFRHYNRKGWLWWGDALFLPNSSEFSTQNLEKRG